jgi:ubiquinone/menaquinone biosynthesis C-methylase UbiE
MNTHTDGKTMVREVFSAAAANYSVSTVHARGPDLARMVAAGETTGRERLLDAGSGAGHTALAFAPHVAQVVALDLSEAMLAQGARLAAERGLTNIDFRTGDVEQLPFASGEFDLAASRYSAHHWPHPQQALAELHRVLRPGGRFLLGDIISYDDFTCDTYLQAIELLRDPSHVRDHTLRQWLGMLTDAGFDAEEVFTFPVRLDFSDWVGRVATPPEDVAALRNLLDGAPQEVRAILAVEVDHSFTLQGAVIRGRKA